jgi:hypothetical protein
VRRCLWLLGFLFYSKQIFAVALHSSVDPLASAELGQSRDSLERVSDLKPKTLAPSKVELSLKEQDYGSDGQTARERHEYSYLGIDANFHARGDDFDAGGQGIYQGAMQSSTEQYLGVPELYIAETQTPSGLHLTVGRQKRHWSRFDEEFGMGIWQPQLRWDYLDPIQQGLTGVFFDYKWGSTKLTFFTSPLFLPDQGPSFRLRNGVFDSENRWFWKPQTTMQVMGQRWPLYYDLDTPRTDEIIYESSLGGSVRFQQPGNPFWVQTSYALKPMNQLHLAIECTQCAGTPADVHAKLHPSVLMHRVVTVEAGLEDDNQVGWLSVTRDQPLDPKGEPNWIQATHTTVTYAGASYAHIFQFVGKPSWLKLSYLQAFEEKQPQTSSLVDDRVESSLDRFPYQQVAAIEWNWTISNKIRNQWRLRTRYTYSIPERGSWLSSQIFYQLSKWGWNLGVDVLGANVDPTSSNAGLFSRYRANDRATAGVTYAF